MKRSTIIKGVRRTKRREMLLIAFFLLMLIPSGYAQQLQSYILEAEKNSPEIQGVQLRFERAIEKVNEADALPDTEISGGYFVREPETRTGPQKARYSIRQMIPWFGTITARENYAAAMADEQYVEVVLAKRKLALNVAQSYYKLYTLQEKQDVLTKNISLLEDYHELALNSLEVGSASAVDVLRLQIRQNDLVQQKRTLAQELDAEKVYFNNLLNRAQDREVKIPDSLALPEEEVISSLQVAQVHPELLKFERLYESVSKAELLNQKEALPKLGVGLDYVSVAERPDMSVDQNGKDILMPMISLSIPLFNSKYRSVSRQNELRRKEIEVQREERLNQLENVLASAINSRTSARITAETFLRNLNQAKDAEEILLKSYETGTIDFTDVLEIQELQLKFQVGLLEAIKTYYQQTAMVHYLSRNTF